MAVCFAAEELRIIGSLVHLVGAFRFVQVEGQVCERHMLDGIGELFSASISGLRLGQIKGSDP